MKHKKIMDSLINEHKELVEIINSKEISYLDIPMHLNVGDLLIMHGTLEFFKKHSIKCKHIFSVFNFVPQSVNKNTVLVFHGGGNLGDLYDLHQNFRENIISSYPNHKIIILPQTIYFEKEENYERCCELFSKHTDLHICTRDKRSFELAKRMTNHVYLLPDMAHNLYPLKYDDKPIKKLLCFQRIDKEATSKIDCSDADTISDWDILLKNETTNIKIYQRVAGLLTKLRLRRVIAQLWIIYSKYLVKKAIKLFGEHEEIHTNRLHGHILACLMDKPNVVYDNSYGKNSAYANLWTKTSDLVTIKEDK